MEELERTQTIRGARLSEVFAFFSDPRNLARITPPRLSFRIVGTVPSPLAAGSRLEYRIRWILWSLRWVTRITRWDPPFEFEDVQEKGPY
ncbi:MAG TPA: CDP-paratose 2-epimerase, partial [Thermoanaerobaculia bacterium]|nr:CDP-paratose 2-epimerase [Thermoanaerobaculia bacterium]